MPKQEILPPERMVAVQRPERLVPAVPVPSFNTGGFIDSAITGWQANYTTRAVQALTRRDLAKVELFDAQTKVVESTIRKQETLLRYQETPERLAHELAVRRVRRANEYREAQHHYEMNEVRRLKELTQAEKDLTHAKAELTHARTLLVDAEQQLRAQQEHGYFNYELAHKKKAVELLDVALSEAERRLILKQHVRELDTADADAVDEALYSARAELNASGLDCSRLDAAIDARKSKRNGDE